MAGSAADANPETAAIRNADKALLNEAIAALPLPHERLLGAGLRLYTST